MAEFEVGRCHLCQRHRVVEWCYGDITAVDDAGPGCVGVYTCPGIETSEGSLAR